MSMIGATSESQADHRGRLVGRYDGRIALALLLTILAVYAFFAPHWADWSANSRLNLIMAVVDDGTLQIDRYRENTGDYAYFEGHYYSDKAPGSALLGVPVYWMAQRLGLVRLSAWLADRVESHDALAATLRTDGQGVTPSRLHAALALSLVTVLTVAVPSALLGPLLYLLLRRLGISAPAAVLAVLTYALLTPAFPYSWNLYSHQQVAALLVGAFFLALPVVPERSPRAMSLAVGLMLGWAVISEYPAALIALPLAAYACRRPPRVRRAAYALLGGALPAMVLAIHNLAIYRTPFVLGYQYSALYAEQHSTGLISISSPSVAALWGITFGAQRGIFYVTPVLLLGLWGFRTFARHSRWRAEWALCAWSVISFLLFNGSSVMWQGGYAVGPRYLLPMLPFLAVSLAFFLDDAGWRLPRTLLFAGLAAWSFFAVWTQALGGQSFPDWSARPLFGYSWPLLVAGDIARNVGMMAGLGGWASLAPLALLLLAGMGLLAVLVSRPGRPSERPRASQCEPAAT